MPSPSVSIPAVPSSTLRNGVFIDLVLGAGPAIGTPQGSLLCVAQGITSGFNFIGTVTVSSGVITPASSSFSAGTQPVTTVWYPASAAEAATMAGPGSEAHRMVKAAMEANPNARVAVAQLAAPTSGPSAASVVLALQGTADAGGTGIDGMSANGTLVVTINGKAYTVPFLAGDSTASVIASLVTALSDPECPVYIPYTGLTKEGIFSVASAGGALSGYSAGAFGITLKSKGIGKRFNGLSIVVEIYNAAGALSYTLTGAGTGTNLTTGATGSGLTASLFKSITPDASSPTFTALTTAGFFDNGAGTEASGAMSTFLAIILPLRFERIAVPFTYSTEGASAVTLSSLMAQVALQAGPSSMLYQQVEAMNIGGLTTASTGAAAEAVARNSKLLNLLWVKNSQTYPGEGAADFAARRLGGDYNLGGQVVGETEMPSTNLCGMQTAIRQSYLVSDRPAASEIEYALHNGVTPLEPSSVNAGLTMATRPITTYCRDTTGQPDTTCLDLNNVTVPQFVADLIRTEFPKTFANCNLIPDTDVVRIPRQVRPKDVKEWSLALLRDKAESLGYIIDVDSLEDQMVFAIPGNNRTRLNGRIPVRPSPWFVTGVFQVRGV